MFRVSRRQLAQVVHGQRPGIGGQVHDPHCIPAESTQDRPLPGFVERLLGDHLVPNLFGDADCHGQLAFHQPGCAFQKRLHRAYQFPNGVRHIIGRGTPVFCLCIG